MKVVVTGAAGFIGSNLVRRLNKLGVSSSDILIVDRLDNDMKARNINDLSFDDIVDYADFRLFERVMDFKGRDKLVVSHQGACTDTTLSDGSKMMSMNYYASQQWAKFCAETKARLIYASSAAVYGNSFRPGSSFRSETPLNVYGMSKLLFDRYVTRHSQALKQAVGLRYFNVYGQNELHKGKMASMVSQLCMQSLSGKMTLYAGSDMYMRDFVHVDDVVNVNIHFIMDPTARSGIYDCGTGIARSFKDVTRLIASKHFFDAKNNVYVDEIPMPEGLRPAYQTYTCADITTLRAVGAPCPMITLEEGVKRYLEDVGLHKRML